MLPHLHTHLHPACPAPAKTQQFKNNRNMRSYIEEDIDYQTTANYAQDVQYRNAVAAIGRLETDLGGLTINEIWTETEQLREKMKTSPEDLRSCLMAGTASNYLLTKFADKTSDPHRSRLCILTLFALRLIKASPNKDDNPHHDLIEAILKLIGYETERQPYLRHTMKELLDIIDSEGDYNEARGKAVDFGHDILANDNSWNSRLRNIVEAYMQKAYDANIISGGEKALEAFRAVWEALLADRLFVAQMKTPSLGQDFNLLLLFNIYGLMPTWIYDTKVRGGLSLAKTVGYNPTLKNANHCYSKDYFNPNEIAKLNKGIKTQADYDHIKQIIDTHSKSTNNGI